VDIIQKMSVERDGVYEGILADSAIEIVRDHPELRRQLRDILDSDRTTVYRYDGDTSLAMVMLIDDQAAICNHGSGGPKMEAVISDDGAFRSWVESYFESIRADAQALDTDAFAP
jgi:predicted transcriptional regulator